VLPNAGKDKPKQINLLIPMLKKQRKTHKTQIMAEDANDWDDTFYKLDSSSESEGLSVLDARIEDSHSVDRVKEKGKHNALS